MVRVHRGPSLVRRVGRRRNLPSSLLDRRVSFWTLMPNLIWFAALLLGLGLVIVLPRVAWYALMSYRQKVRYAKQVQLATSRGMSLPERPAPPDLWGVQRRVNRIAFVLGLAGALIATAVLAISSHR